MKKKKNDKKEIEKEIRLMFDSAIKNDLDPYKINDPKLCNPLEPNEFQAVTAKWIQRYFEKHRMDLYKVRTDIEEDIIRVHDLSEMVDYLTYCVIFLSFRLGVSRYSIVEYIKHDIEANY